MMFIIIQYDKIKPVRRRGGRRGFRPPSFWNSVKKKSKKIRKKGILKQVVVC
jgi:hypothetical protein